jgi:NAD(P)-dependent dehydrogenase (short-subunit alcohol dehydrogenase family)
MTKATRRWLITGCSTGFGRALAERVIAQGDHVYATARDPASLDTLVNGHPNAEALRLDVTRSQDIDAAVAHTVAKTGGIDVLVNNAGYGYLAAVEEGDEAEYRAMFETNFFGLIALTRAYLPLLREQGSGNIVNISSVGGLVGNVGSAFYAATKFALTGFSEALSKEVAPLGIKVTVIAPGPFRTDWAGRSLRTASQRIDAYGDTVHARLDQLSKVSGHQAGDPVRAADAIIDVVRSDAPPLHLVLGAAGLKAVRDKTNALKQTLDQWEAVSVATDFPAAS